MDLIISMNTIGDRLKKIRKSRGKSQAEIAAIIEADQTYISKLEKNNIQGGLKAHELLLIAEALEYDPFVFIGKMSLEKGDLKRKNSQGINDLIKTIREQEITIQNMKRIIESNDTDELSLRMSNNPHLKAIVQQLISCPDHLLERIIAYMTGIQDGIESTQKKRSGSKTA